MAGLWLLSPADLLPELLPVIGPLDYVVVALALRYAARRVPHEVLMEAWPGEHCLLERLLGTPARRAAGRAGGRKRYARAGLTLSGPGSGRVAVVAYKAILGLRKMVVGHLQG